MFVFHSFHNNRSHPGDSIYGLNDQQLILEHSWILHNQPSAVNVKQNWITDTYNHSISAHKVR